MAAINLAVAPWDRCISRGHVVGDGVGYVPQVRGDRCFGRFMNSSRGGQYDLLDFRLAVQRKKLVELCECVLQ